MAAVDAHLAEWQEILETAMRFATNCATAYARASAGTRRRFNQAVFSRIDVRDGKIATVGYHPPFDLLFSSSEFEYGDLVDLRREFSNSCTSAKSLVRRLLRRVGKCNKVAQESPVPVFEDARGPNVRELRQEQRRLSAVEAEALIAEYEAGKRVGELAKVYGIHRTTVSAHVARAGKTRPAMTEAQIDEAVRLYGLGWTLLGVGRRLGVADKTVRRVLVERAVTIRPGGRGKVASVA